MPTKPRGGVAVEMALILPLLILLLDVIIEMSLVMYDHTIVHNAAREAVRGGMVYHTPKLTDAEITAIASTYTDTYLLSLGAADPVDIQVQQSAGAGSQTPLRVTVSYRYTSLLVGSFLSAIAQPITLTGTTSQANE